ncbi:MAG: hypothetical protein D6698_01545 [Gammaproteobacteria bacterium]|nr:MAG: hypothetical protein D6698_01545 [Gammaproteobacteria bacterium]
MEKINIKDPTEISEWLPFFRKENIPVLILGAPGIGKSESIQSCCEEDDTFVDIRLSMMEPPDVLGLQKLQSAAEEALRKYALARELVKSYRNIGQNEKADELEQRALKDLELAYELADEAPVKTFWSRPSIWPTHGKGIICLEELNTAPQGVQNTLLQALGSPPDQDRFVGPHRIPKTYYWCATGNRKEDLAHVYPLSSALRNRMVIVLCGNPNVERWSIWASQNDVHSHIIAFINFKPDMLYAPPTRNDPYSGFPSPRAWSRLVSPMVKHGINNPDFFASAVGEGAGMMFHTFLAKMKDLPDIKAILEGRAELDPKKISTRPSLMHVIATSTYEFVARDTRLLPAAVERILPHLKPEIAMVFATLIVRNKNQKVFSAVRSCRPFLSWINQYSDVLNLS